MPFLACRIRRDRPTVFSLMTTRSLKNSLREHDMTSALEKVLGGIGGWQELRWVYVKTGSARMLAVQALSPARRKLRRFVVEELAKNMSRARRSGTPYQTAKGRERFIRDRFPQNRISGVNRDFRSAPT